MDILKKFDEKFTSVCFMDEKNGYEVLADDEIKQFIQTELEELAREAIGKIDADEALRGSVDPTIYYNAQGWNAHRRLTVAVFEKRGVKI